MEATSEIVTLYVTLSRLYWKLRDDTYLEESWKPVNYHTSRPHFLGISAAISALLLEYPNLKAE